MFCSARQKSILFQRSWHALQSFYSVHSDKQRNDCALIPPQVCWFVITTALAVFLLWLHLFVMVRCVQVCLRMQLILPEDYLFDTRQSPWQLT